MQERLPHSNRRQKQEKKERNDKQAIARKLQNQNIDLCNEWKEKDDVNTKCKHYKHAKYIIKDRHALKGVTLSP